MQHELRFYKAFKEDSEFALELFEAKKCSPRHVVVLFHDALEFIFYECLLLNDIDIYENGQNTIGFDKAYSALIKTGYKIPYGATIREIQKLRGDAKHHAQDIDWEKIEQLAERWRIVCVCLTWDYISSVAQSDQIAWAAVECSRSQFTLYQKSRNKDWLLSLKHIITALIHKKCDLDKAVERPLGICADNPHVLFGKLANVLETGLGSCFFAPQKAAIETAIKSKEYENACDIIARIYSSLDSTNPTYFDIKSARFITDRLALASARRFGKLGMSWCKWSSADTKLYNEYSNEIQKVLAENKGLVQKFGEPYYDDDGDRYWKWWEFVVFDGLEWHSFHLDHGFRISGESYHLSDDGAMQRELAAKVALQEFKKAAQQGCADGARDG